MSSKSARVMSDDAASVDVPFGGAVMKGRSGLARIWYAAGYSAAGLKAAYRGEAAFRQLVLLNLLLIPLAFLLDVSRVECAVVIAVVFLGLIVELLNSAIDATADRNTFELKPLAKQPKDLGSSPNFSRLRPTARGRNT